LRGRLGHRLDREEIAFERERPIGHAGIAALGLVAIHMDAVAGDKGMDEDIEVMQRRFRIGHAGPQATHPRP